MRASVALVVLVLAAGVPPAFCFLRPHQFLRSKYLQAPKPHVALIRRFMAARYGPDQNNLVPPKEEGDSASSAGVVDVEQEEWERAEEARVARQKVEFRKLIQEVMSTSNPDHLPSLLTKHMELLLTMRGYEGAELIEQALKEAKDKGNDGPVSDAIEYILSFAEAFVDQALTLDDYNKKLLGKIIREITNKSLAAREREQLLDELMEREKKNFTPGFLKHVEGECERIAAASVVTRESSRLLEIMRIIQARVLEELGKDIGEEALVLGQLLGYDDRRERMAVLDAGLTVRGYDFAKEMAALTEEALDGFTRVHGGADPDLVERVSEIDRRLRQFMGQNKPRP